MNDYRPAVEAIVRQHGCSPQHNPVRYASNGSEIWWDPTTKSPILMPVSIPTPLAANSIMTQLGLGRVFA